MKGTPAFQFYPADYLADENVMLMTLEEEGAYIRAMAFCWREGSIPADEIKLSRLLKNASLPIVRLVASLFEPMANDGSRLVHPRLNQERTKQEAWLEKSRDAGIKSGKVRRQAKELRSEPHAKVGSDLVEPKANSSFSSSSSSSKEPPISPTGDRETDHTLAARMLCEMIDDHDVHHERAYSDMIKSAVALGSDARDRAKLMADRWAEYQKANIDGKLAWANGSAYKFFTSGGTWDKPELWPWEKGKRPQTKAKKYAEMPGREA